MPTDDRPRTSDGPLTFASEQVDPYGRADARLLNAEIEGLYKFITTRYKVTFDMMVILTSVLVTIGHEGFHPGSDPPCDTPVGTMHQMLDDMIQQYLENQKKRVH